MNSYRKFCWVAFTVVLAASLYPLYMGVIVVTDMIRFGTVYAESYPKYIIPYTPIALALIIGVAIMPLLFKIAKKHTLFAGSAISVIIFFISEILLESQVIVTTTVATTLESWQMFMCYVPPEGYATRTWTEVDVLIGAYSPTFKIHFYFISLILILSLINCIYGFAKMLKSGDSNRKKALILQAISSGLFLGLCIFACFTAFFRAGEITVSPLSAALMVVFFMVMGITVGIYACSLLLGKRQSLSVVVPSVAASAVVLVMYIGEMFLLSGNLYRFGDGFFFKPLGVLVLAPADIVVVLLSGVSVYLITHLLNNERSWM